MNTDLDHDDRFGERIRALRAWEPASGTAQTWRRIEQRRRRTRIRRASCGAVVLVVAAGVAAVAVDRSLTTRERVSVVSPSPPSPEPAQVLETAPVGALAITPQGPYRAAQQVNVTLAVSHAFTPDRPDSQGLAVCYPWGSGELCDATVQSHLVTENNAGTSMTFELTVPGWVFTPTGLQACGVLHCRFELANADGTRIGTTAVDITSGPKPEDVARITSIHARDGSVDISIDGIKHDPSWSQWSATASSAAVAALPSGGIRLCVLFSPRQLCDGLLQPDPPRFDGDPHTFTVRTNRLLYTQGGWIDCTKVECVVEITRTVDVRPGQCSARCRRSGRNAVDAGTETVALLPYQLPDTTPEMAVPTLTITPTEHLHIGDTITVTLHDPPSHSDAAAFRIGVCAADAGTGGDCTIPNRYPSDNNEPQQWTTLADGSLQQLLQLSTADPNGQYVTIMPPTLPFDATYPYIARTNSILVTLTPAEQAKVDANRARRVTSTTSP